ncbi:M23 family metallopeptidase [Streptomyces sp. ME19-01-6]|uniref:M23 family metallopeptidase n=1 Tax=Streptomyces sp. ME19-01-6 TaxID=3028686 RepID=UPI0029BCF3CC|nr:M23 family metallopeptidase [Streptomyces sp. ME19-01-6]MDX3226732.1 M23 family metallopeptidase [Streptomyces sp. ME19-01-6]
MKRRLAVVLGGALVACALSMPTASAAEPPIDFQLPFTCGQKWQINSYDTDHAPALDLVREPDQVGTEGALLTAPADGVVNQSFEHENAGNMIQIDHGDDYFTTYIHLQSRSVKVGDTVKQGQEIGRVGKTGETSNGHPHLHFEMAIDADHDGRATWGQAGSERVNAWFDGVEYGGVGETWRNVASKNCDGDPGPGPDPEPEPEPAATTLAYTGDKSISNGSDAKLSAVLKTKDPDEPVEGREVTFALGSGDTAQTCDGKTDAKGTATCTVEVADQALTDDATVPLAAAFAGDDEYKESEDTEKLKLQHVEGRSYGLTAKVPLPLLPVGIDPTPDTGTVRTAEAETKSPACAQDVSAVILTADALCAEVVTSVGPSGAKATATVADVSIGLPGLPVIGVSGVTSESSSSCSSAKGSVSLELTVAGQPVSIPDTPGYEVDLGVAGKLVVNEQIPVADADHGLTVNAVHLTTPTGADVVIGSSTSSAHDCA